MQAIGFLLDDPDGTKDSLAKRYGGGANVSLLEGKCKACANDVDENEQNNTWFECVTCKFRLHFACANITRMSLRSQRLVCAYCNSLEARKRQSKQFRVGATQKELQVMKKKLKKPKAKKSKPHK